LRVRKKLGEILVEGGLLTQKQLEEALPFQKRSHLKLGQFLVREGIINESQIVELVSNQLRLEKYRDCRAGIEPTAPGEIPSGKLRHRYGPYQPSAG
jgi:type IV pilus assembly protein PilB